MDPGRLRPRIVGRYALYAEIGAGGMASVHLGRLLGRNEFTRTIAIKVLHASFAKDPSFVAMLLDEARISALIQHPNVVSTLDMVTADGELFVVMDYVHGVSLARLIELCGERGEKIPARIAAGILNGVLLGLHAAHEVTKDGTPLGIVHRDVSPHNILVGQDGTPRLLDFGVAKAVGQHHVTRTGMIKGKLSYMAPEHLNGHATRQSDVYSVAIVLWEALTGKQLVPSGETVKIEPPSGSLSEPSLTTDQLDELDETVMRGLESDLAIRFATAQEMAAALEAAVPLASSAEIGEWVTSLAAEELATRAALVTDVERASLEDLADLPSVAAEGSAKSEARSSVSRRTFVLLALGCLGVFLVAFAWPSREPIAPLPQSSARPPLLAPSQPAASTAPAPIDTASAPTPTPSPAKAQRPAPSLPHAKPRGPNPCDQPYVIDSAGRKIFKDECLH